MRLLSLSFGFLVVLNIILAVVLTNCRKPPITDPALDSQTIKPEVGSHNYPFSENDKLVALGRVLFYDRNLSFNNSVSCGSCHQQSRAFCDNLPVSAGLRDHKTSRNTPGLFAKRTRLFWDGLAKNMGDLVLRPVANHDEMGITNFRSLSDKLTKTSYYADLFLKAFGSRTIDSTRVNAALSEFLRNFLFSNNKFRRSQIGSEALTASENLGRDLFFGKAKCSKCHNIIIIDPGQLSPYGNEFDEKFTGFNIGLDESYSDRGIAKITGKESDVGKFIIPVLLNVEYTYPYMHDGRFNSLEQVIEHYNSGIKDHPNLDINLRDLGAYPGMNTFQVMENLDTNKDGMLDKSEASTVPPQRLNLTVSEKRQLVEFLGTLSDPGIRTDERFGDPFRAAGK